MKTMKKTLLLIILLLSDAINSQEALELFSLSNLEKIGFLNSKKINQLLIKHQNTSNKSNKLLWNIYIFLKWNSK